MIRFAAPEWLIFLPILLGLALWRRELRLWLPMRAAILTLLGLVLLQPELRRLGRGLDLWILVDRSVSAADALEPRLEEIEALLERSKGADDRIFYIDYANLAQRRGDVDPIPLHQRQQTRTGLAIHTALGQMPGDRAARLLVLTDGYSTEPLGDAAERLARQRVALDYRLASPPDAADYRISDLRLPARAQLREPFMIEVEIAGAPDGELPLVILRDGTRIASTQAVVTGGRASARFHDRLTQPGAHRYAARIQPANDSRPGNNLAERWIEIAGGPRLLLVTSYLDDPVARVLSGQGFSVETVTDPAALSVGQLSGAKAVLLNNVPAHTLPSEFIAALDFFVRTQGGGLLMAGGKHSFGAGGWFGSPIDALLPVSMELRSEHRKLAVAMAIVLDRSGSMSASVAGGMQKIDLANEGAARSVDLLTPMDGVTVFAVDTEPHCVVPLTSPGAERGKLTDTIRRITSGGGGICVPTGLRAAWTELQKAKAGQRHVILFADANDATQEIGDYQKLLADMTADGVTVSVIGLGSESDSGGKFLRDVAELGKGRLFFNANPNDLPALFAQETVAVARSAFIDEPTKLTAAASWHEIAAKPLAWLEAVDGYNLSYVKPEATASAFSADEYSAPLVAHWQRGAGRVGAVSFPLGGDFSQRTRAWAGYGDFLQTMSRWLMGEEIPPGIGLRTRLDGTRLGIELRYDRTWEPRIAQAAPLIALADGASGETRPLTWERMEPGRFRAAASLDPDHWVRGAVQVGAWTLPFGPIVAGGSVEWALDPARLAELRAVSQESGGVERIDLGRIWQAPRREEFRDLRPALLITLLALFLADVLWTRLGGELPKWAPLPLRKGAPQREGAPAVPATRPVPAAPPPKPEPVPPDRRSRFARARRDR